jgi:uncharacterized membrane protein
MMPLNEPAEPTLTSTEQYLDALRRALAGSDPALIQDAVYDAEEYLRNEGGSDTSTFAKAVQRFGTPHEVAEAYRSNDRRVSAALASPPRPVTTGFVHRVFSVFTDPHAYGALLFQLLALPTGILYFVWAVTGLALSLGLSVLIIGLPVLLGYLASIRLFSLMEGRVVESLLGVRMPRRPGVAAKEGSILHRLGEWLRDRRTWTTLLYMLMKLPLGILSFVIFIVLLVLPLALMSVPFTQEIFEIPVVAAGSSMYYLPAWLYPVCWLAAGVDMVLLMHFARLVGRGQAAMAKAMLVER